MRPLEPAGEVERLGLDEVHVWSADLDRLPEAVLGEPLSADERDRGRRFHFERDRRRFVAARGLLRRLLGRYLGLDPSRLRFGYGPRGKPFLAGEGELRFNVSHSGGLALLAFAWDRDLGVDVEEEREVEEAEDIARRTFSPWEEKELRLLAAVERRAAFFRCWTRKEAFIKATGDGLSRPLDTFDVTLGPGEPARLLRVAGEPEAGRRFWLEDLRPAPRFAGALAVEGRKAKVVRRNWNGVGRLAMGHEETEDKTVYKVVLNHEEQYSIWPADRENPPGWRDAGKSGPKEECLAYIKEVWTDMRPLSLRKRMDDSARQG